MTFTDILASAMRSIIVFVSILSLPIIHSVHAQSMNASDGTCRGAVDTYDLVQCLDRALKKADANLNSTYVKVQNVLAPEEREELVHAQRLWMQYRDATCKAEYDLYGGGTGGPPTRLACLEAETSTREASLQRSYGWVVEKFGR